MVQTLKSAATQVSRRPPSFRTALHMEMASSYNPKEWKWTIPHVAKARCTSFLGCPNEIAKLSCDADAGLVDGFALVKAQQKRDRSMNRTIRNGKHWPVQHIWMAKMEPTAWLDALPQDYGRLRRDPFKDGPHIFLVKFHLSVDCSQRTRLYPDTTLIGLRVFDWATSYDNPECHCMMVGQFPAIQRRILERANVLVCTCM
ncbi:hypothetical protein IV203_009536 [Nitzschia inconspicua]|uniref:Uncharacterized protein n=1 Tax=Nitzschia inconspicua TaxID=303405 RepID=A0A9K3KVS9_9STRA|nr:hypothetical protein IV203_009536 [Nitzschia inconspicua]